MIKRKYFNCKASINQSANSLDEECKQSKIRVMVILSILVYGCLLAIVGWLSINVWFFVGVTTALFVAGGWSYYLNINKTKQKQPNQPCLRNRRIALSTLDVSIISLTMGSLGSFGAVVYPMYLWIIVGNGIRYGVTHAIAGAFQTLVMFGTVLMFSTFWSNNLIIGIGLLIGVFMLPPFYLKLIHRLQVLNHKLQTYAYETWYAATHDQLTGVYNRASLFEKFERMLDDQTCNFTVAFIDLDDFKHINDTYGHNFGDIVLRKTVHRIKSTIRNGDVVGRIGGDELAIIFPNLGNEDLISEMGERLVKCTSQTVQAEGQTVTPSVSIGMVKATYDDTCSDSLMAKADHMMYVAKNRGKNSYAIYQKE